MRGATSAALHAAVVAAVAAGAYAATLMAGFVWDDHAVVEANRQITSLAELPAVFGAHAFSGAGGLLEGERFVEYYRPIWISWLAVIHAVCGPAPLGYHLGSILLHAATSVAVLLLARVLIADATAAWIAALLFAVHPTHVEAVAWVAASNEPLAGLLSVLFVTSYVRWRRAGGPASAAVGLGCFTLALLSKETAVVLPLLALAWEALPGRDRPGRRALGPLVLGALALAYLALRALVVHPHPEVHPLAWRLLTAPRLLAEYLRLLVFPTGLKVFHDVGFVTRASDVAFLLPLGVLLVAASIAWRARARAPVLFLGLAWTLVSLLPVSGIPATLQPALLAERCLYLPSVGAALAAGALLARARTRGPGPRAAVTSGTLLALALALFTVVTVRQSLAWRDDLTLMSRMVHDAPRAVVGHANLGVALERVGRFDEAGRADSIAVALSPADHMLRRNLGIVYGKLGRYRDAERELRAALALKPDYAEARANLIWLAAREARSRAGADTARAARAPAARRAPSTAGGAP